MADRLDTATAVAYGFDLFGFAVPLAVGALGAAVGLGLALEGLGQLWTDAGVRRVFAGLLVSAIGWVFVLAGAGGALYKFVHDTGLR